MKNVKAVIGANYGNEELGLMTDYFCSLAPPSEKVLNVRFNGGCQHYGHRVYSLDGEDRNHIFQHFGSGSFHRNVATYLTEDFVVNPMIFHSEYLDLSNRLGIDPMVFASPKCLVTFMQDSYISDFLHTRNPDNEILLLDANVGARETVIRSKKDSAVTLGTLTVLGMQHFQIDIEYYDNDRIEKVFGIKLTEDEKMRLNDQWARVQFDQDLRFLMNHVTLVDERIFRRFNYMVFEGSLGLLRDKNCIEGMIHFYEALKHKPDFPTLTMDNTGIQNIVPYLDEQVDAEIVYVTRPYLEASRKHPLDIKKLMDRCEKDFEPVKHFAKLSYAVTHMNEALKSDLMPYSDNLYLAYGPTRNDVKKVFEND